MRNNGFSTKCGKMLLAQNGENVFSVDLNICFLTSEKTYRHQKML